MAALGGRPQGDHLPAVQMADGGADHKSKKTDHGTAPEAGLSLMIFVQNVENKGSSAFLRINAIPIHQFCR